MPRRSLLFAFAAAGLIALAVSLGWEWQHRLALDARLAAAQDSLRVRDQTLAKNKRLTTAVQQLSALKQRRQDREAYDARWAPDGLEPLAKGYVARADLKNKGNATPRDAYETYWWALDHLDTATLAKLFYFQPKARQGLDAYFATLPEEVREQYGDATQLYATLYANGHPLNFTGGQIGGGEVSTNEPYMAKLDVSLQYEDGQTRDHKDYAVVINPQFKTTSAWQIPASLGEFRNMMKSLSTAPGN